LFLQLVWKIFVRLAERNRQMEAITSPATARVRDRDAHSPCSANCQFTRQGNPTATALRSVMLFARSLQKIQKSLLPVV
jgi:hypothetical protein